MTTGLPYKDKIRLVAFAQDATRTLDIFVQGDVIDIINPTVAKANELFLKDCTVMYELRVNPLTKIVLFRQDPCNTPVTYVAILVRYSGFIRHFSSSGTPSQRFLLPHVGLRTQWT